jgi:integrase
MAASITSRTIEALKPGQFVWHDTLKGFGVRGLKGGAAYLIRYRAGKGRGAPQRFMTIGMHGALDKNGKPWTPKAAYDRAIVLLGRAKDGGDPALAGRDVNCESVAQLCDLYLDAAKGGRILDRQGRAKKPSTPATDAYRIEAHIKTLLGKHRVIDLTRASIEAAMQKIAEGKSKGNGSRTKARGKRNARGGKGTATRTIGLLGAILSHAVRLGIRPDNPAAGVRRYADGRKERRLTDKEFRALGDALANTATSAGAITHLLAVTGWRRGEAVNLRWADVDLTRKTVTLTDTKTGRSVRPLSTAAAAILKGQPGEGEFVFPAARASTGTGTPQPTQGFPRQFLALRKAAGLPADVSPHVLRHSFASVAADLGYSEATIAALLGHRGRTITGRYTHSADAVLVSAADAVASAIEGAMFPDRSRAVVLSFNRSSLGRST